MTPRPRHRRPHRLPSAAGFTLIEIMVAMVVFAIGLLSLAIVVPLGSNRIGKAGKQTHASTLAAQRAEQLLITNYGDGLLTAGAHVDTKNPLDGSYYVRWTVSDNVPIFATKTVIVTVARGAATNTPEATVTIVCPAAGS